MTPEEAVEATLAGEHAAVYLYGVLGARLSASAQADLYERVREAYTLHRGRRDQLIAMARAMDVDPVAAEISYELPNAATTPVEIQRAAREIEERCAALYADMVGNTSQANRQWALEALQDAAVRLLALGGEPEPFPGIKEL